MTDTTRLSKRISWLLRHGANQTGLAMDAAGWASIDDVLQNLGISRSDLDRAVTENDKNRLQVDGVAIRACQGHSPAGTPVTLEALESSWTRVEPTVSLWHGTALDAIQDIARDGLSPRERTHVHLAAGPDSRVGKRHNIDLRLEISAHKLAEYQIPVFRALNGVFLARHIPAAAITDITAQSDSGRQNIDAIRRRFRLVH